MNKHCMSKLRARRGGINRVVALLLALIAVMLIVIALPSLQNYRDRAQVIACEQALNSARDGLIIEYFNSFQEGSVEDARDTLDAVLPARSNICPSGGTVYLLRGGDGIFEPICGLHDPDERQRCRLNASRARELLEDALKKYQKRNDDLPDSLDIELNSQTLTCQRVEDPLNIKRGTATTNGYDGIVAFFGIAGNGDFPAKGAKEGDLCYFVYADEKRCATWQSKEGWTGDAYQ